MLRWMHHVVITEIKWTFSLPIAKAGFRRHRVSIEPYMCTRYTGLLKRLKLLQTSYSMAAPVHTHQSIGTTA